MEHHDRMLAARGEARSGSSGWMAPSPFEVSGGPTWEGPTLSAQHCDGPTFTPPDAHPLESGLWVGRYLLIEPIGAGGQAVVWRAVQREPFVREVALKLLDRLGDRCPRKLARLRREAERGQRLRSAALLPALEFGTEGEVAYIAMPLVRGCTLSQVIRGRRSLADQKDQPPHPLSRMSRAAYTVEVLKILINVARSLHDAHQAGVAHRDIKPSNILLDFESREIGYLIDFGLARDLDVATLAQLRDCAGTPLYMAPEKLLSKQSDEVRCDVYSLGVSIYEALTLRSPFVIPPGLSGVTLMAYLAMHRPKRPRPCHPAFHPDLAEILARAMDTQPENRQSTAAELAADLQNALISGRVLSPRARAAF